MNYTPCFTLAEKQFAFQEQCQNHKDRRVRGLDKNESLRYIFSQLSAPNVNQPLTNVSRVKWDENRKQCNCCDRYLY